MSDLISRKKAIESLSQDQDNDYTDLYHDGYVDGKWDAIDIIKSLPSAQPETHEKRTETHACDLISRQAAIDAIEKAMCEDGFRSSTGLVHKTTAYEIIRHFPSAQPDMSEYSDKLWKAAYERGKAEAQQRWIPCSARLPEEADYKGCSECIDGAVWYYTDKGAMGLGYYYESTKAWSTTYDECPYGEVIAWMPLPEPYKGEQNGKA